ncbi:MAG: 5-formyltetrahydrofolate cyclo-ligase [Agriterribacter sp.]
MTKKELRSLYKQKRTQLNETEVEKMQDLILIHFQQLSLPFLQSIHTYLPVYINQEVDTFPIIDFLKFRNPGLQVVVPKSDFANSTMRNYLYDDNTVLIENKYGIMEPEDGLPIDNSTINVVLVPLLAFDKAGNRVGYGKGFYDRFLADCNEDVVKIGLSFFEAEDQIDDTDEFDIPLTYCVTPRKVYEF